MNASPKSITELLNRNTRLAVPYFQRSYVWELDAWKRLWKDLHSVYTNPHSYFLGSVIIKETGTTFNTIIDGQQRLTTLMVLLKALHLREANPQFFTFSYFQNGDANNDPIILHNKHDRPLFNEIMKLDGVASPINQSGLIRDAWDYFKAKTRELTPTEAKNMRLAIETYIRFVAITLDVNDDEQQIFDTINSLGVKLTTGDLLKNYFFNQDNEQVYNSMWAPVFERANNDYWTDEITKGRNKETNIEHFFFALMQIIMCDKSYQIDAATKKLYRLHDRLFANYKDFFHTQNIKDKNPFIALTVEYARNYQSAFNKNCLNRRIASASSVKRLALIMFAKGMFTVIPYILYILHEQPDAEEQERIFNYLENYVVRRIVCRTKNNNYADLFSENLIGQQIKTLDELKDYIEKKAPDASLAMPSDADIIHQVQAVDLSKEAALLLYLLESKHQQSSVTLAAYNDYTVEQLLPSKSVVGVWPLAPGETDDERKAHSLTLGNYMLVHADQKLTNSQRLSTWKNKSTYLRNAAAGLAISLQATTSAGWDNVSLLARNVALATLINECWPRETQDVVQQVVVTEQDSAAVSTVEFTADDVIQTLTFAGEDYEMTAAAYHSNYSSFEKFIAQAISECDTLEQTVELLENRYSNDLFGCRILSPSEVDAQIGESQRIELKKDYALCYIGQSKRGWVVSLDREHVETADADTPLADVIALAKIYKTETVDGIWKLLLRDDQIKGISKALGLQLVLNLDDKTYADMLECINRFYGMLKDSTLNKELTEAKSFDAFRKELDKDIELRQSTYFVTHPYLRIAMFDIIGYVEQYYRKNQNIDINFQPVHAAANLTRVTDLETQEVFEGSNQKAIEYLITKKPELFKKMMVGGYSFVLAPGGNPGKNYKVLGNGYSVFKVNNSQKLPRMLNQMQAYCRQQYKIEVNI